MSNLVETNKQTSSVAFAEFAMAEYLLTLATIDGVIEISSGIADIGKCISRAGDDGYKHTAEEVGTIVKRTQIELVKGFSERFEYFSQLHGRLHDDSDSKPG
ncbi:MAG: hypothetical protein ACR2P1_04995 [Pseudomonadales bacterium]